MSFKNVNEEHVIHSNSDNIEVMAYDNANKVIQEIFESLISRYQIGLETSMRSSGFIFDDINLLYYKFHKINFKWDAATICSNNCIKF